MRKQKTGYPATRSTSSIQDGGCRYEAEALQQLDQVLCIGRRCLLAIACACICISSLCIAWKATQVLRIERGKYSLTQLDADYRWEHEPVDPRRTREKATHKAMASWLGNSTVSGFSAIKIQCPEAQDRGLQFLASMFETESLALFSDQATDKIIEIVSQMPKLENLTLVGSRFTIQGLLNLRNAGALKYLKIDTQRLTPIEMAVLKSELPGVHVTHCKQITGSKYPKEAPARFPTVSLPFATL